MNKNNSIINLPSILQYKNYCKQLCNEYFAGFRICGTCAFEQNCDISTKFINKKLYRKSNLKPS